eukprot:3660478-Amphidinium_carterae.1
MRCTTWGRVGGWGTGEAADVSDALDAARLSGSGGSRAVGKARVLRRFSAGSHAMSVPTVLFSAFVVRLQSTDSWRTRAHQGQEPQPL